MAHLDRQRASRLMSQAGIDALILFSPESFSYATGTASGVATMWRQAGAVAVMVPLDCNMPETAIVSDLFAKQFLKNSHIKDVRESPIWVETTNIDHLDPDQAPESLIRSAWQGAGRSQGSREVDAGPRRLRVHPARGWVARPRRPHCAPVADADP